MSLATQVANMPLPPSAMKFNGVYLEDKVSGYCTESVEGRYNASVDISTRDITGADGADFISKRYQARELSVKYSIFADKKIDLHKKEALVKRYLRDPEAMIKFDDDPEYYWVGTVSQIESEGIDATGSGIFVSTGTITIALNDPFKHAVVTKEFKASKSNGAYEIVIQNDGDGAVPIDYYFEFPSDNKGIANGDIGITSKDGIIELGGMVNTPKEGEEYFGQIVTNGRNNVSQKVLNLDDLLDADADHGKNAMYRSEIMDGALQIEQQPWVDGASYNCLGLNKSSISATDGKWHGGMKTVSLKPDITGHVGAKDFLCHLNHWIDVGDVLGTENLEKTYTANAECEVRKGPGTQYDKSDPLAKGSSIVSDYEQKGWAHVKRDASTNPKFTGEWIYVGSDTTNDISLTQTQNINDANRESLEATIGQCGEQTISFLTAKDELICGFTVWRDSPFGGNNSYCIFKVRGIEKNRIHFPSTNDPKQNPFVRLGGMNDVQKQGGWIRFRWKGKDYWYYDSALVNTECAKVQICMSTYCPEDDNVYSLKMKPYKHNYLRDFWLESQGISQKPSTISPPFRNGSKVRIDGSSSQIYVDELPSQDLEVLGSKYFLAQPGETRIIVRYSTYYTGTPTCKAVIREKYL